jgi:hypothetical protein
MLIKCNECKHDVSDQARACPHCGAPIAQPFANAKKQLIEYYGRIQLPDGFQRVWYGRILPLLQYILGLVVLVSIVVGLYSFVQLIISGGDDEDSLVRLIYCICIIAIIWLVGYFAPKRKLNPHMPMEDYLDVALDHIREKQSHYPGRTRIYNKVTIPDCEPTTSEHVHRIMMDEIIIKNALLAWEGKSPSIPELVNGFIYERDVAPYVDYLLLEKTASYPLKASDGVDLKYMLQMLLEPLREYEELMNELTDKQLKDGEYIRRITKIIYSPQ